MIKRTIFYTLCFTLLFACESGTIYTKVPPLILNTFPDNSHTELNPSIDTDLETVDPVEQQDSDTIFSHIDYDESPDKDYASCSTSPEESFQCEDDIISICIKGKWEEYDNCQERDVTCIEYVTHTDPATGKIGCIDTLYVNWCASWEEGRSACYHEYNLILNCRNGFWRIKQDCSKTDQQCTMTKTQWGLIVSCED